MTPDLVAAHLGQLHPYEHALVLLVAFGPFVVLAFVVRRARRQATEEEQSEQGRAVDGEGHRERPVDAG